MYHRRTQAVKAGAMKSFRLAYTEVTREGTLAPFGVFAETLTTGTDAVSILKSLTRQKQIVSAWVGLEAGGPETHFTSNYLTQLNAAVKRFGSAKPGAFWNEFYSFLRDGSFRLDGITYTIHDPWAGSYQERLTQDEIEALGRAMKRT